MGVGGREGEGVVAGVGVGGREGEGVVAGGGGSLFC